MRKPPMCLQYAMWALAAHGHEKFDTVAEVFYQRARQYAEADELKVSPLFLDFFSRERR